MHMYMHESMSLQSKLKSETACILALTSLHRSRGGGGGGGASAKRAIANSRRSTSLHSAPGSGAGGALRKPAPPWFTAKERNPEQKRLAQEAAAAAAAKLLPEQVAVVEKVMAGK